MSAAGVMKSVVRAAAWLALALAAPAFGATVEYLHTDALGSVVAVSNSAGAVIERREYEPYGRQLKPAVPEDGPAYTGHVSDAATGLSYMQQRYYDPFLGRFLSVDPVTADGGTGANFNRYWYGNNNPYRFTDPDGRLVQDNWRGPFEGGMRHGPFDGACGRHPVCLSAGDSGGAKPSRSPEEEDYYAQRAQMVERGQETFKEVGIFTAKEAGQMFAFARLGKWLGGLGRFLRVSDDAAKIAGGHAFTKHGKEFASLGIRSQKQFARHVDDVMANPTATRNLERGRVAFWDRRSGTVVIRDPSSVDGGTAFIPTRGVDYFNGLR